MCHVFVRRLIVTFLVDISRINKTRSLHRDFDADFINQQSPNYYQRMNYLERSASAGSKKVTRVRHRTVSRPTPFVSLKRLEVGAYQRKSRLQPVSSAAGSSQHHAAPVFAADAADSVAEPQGAEGEAEEGGVATSLAPLLHT